MLELVPWTVTYFVSALLSFGMAIEVLLRNQESSLHRLFFAFGSFSASYLLLGFFVLNAPDPYMALELFRISNAFYFLLIAILAYFVYRLAGHEGGWLFFIPPVLVATLSVFIPYNLQFSNYGWKFSAVPNVEGLITFLYLISYSLFIAITLNDLRTKAKAPWLSTKYGLMLLGFLFFQILGVILFNALTLIWKDIPHFAGVFYFFSLIFIWYGFKIEHPGDVTSTRTGSRISDSYRNFINKFLEIAPSDELGLRSMDLLEYLDRTRLSDVVTYDRLRIILNAEKMEQLDNIRALEKTIEYLENKEWSDKIADELMDIVESAYGSVEQSNERMEEFQTMLLNHQQFLERTDIIYGLIRGKFLEFIRADESLYGLPEWKAVLRIYKRLLLPLRGFVLGPIMAEFSKKIRSMDVIKYLDVSENGDIGMEHVSTYLESLPEERRAEAIRNGFNGLISWLAQELMTKDPLSFTKYMKTIRRTVRLNVTVKGVWRTYFSLVDRLQRDLGRTRIGDLILAEGHKPEDLDGFSSAIGLTHDRLKRENILMEYDPRFSYEFYIRRMIEEISANSERCVLFTRGGSKIHRISAQVGNVQVRILATPGVQEEGSVPYNDVTQLIHATSKALDSEVQTWIVFDNVSDLILSVGAEYAYAFARHATDVIASKNSSSIFLLNMAAHNLETRASFEGLFSTIVEIAEKPKLIKG